jgi:hypothetical protein
VITCTTIKEIRGIVSSSRYSSKAELEKIYNDKIENIKNRRKQEEKEFKLNNTKWY